MRAEHCGYLYSSLQPIRNRELWLLVQLAAVGFAGALWLLVQLAAVGFRP